MPDITQLLSPKENESIVQLIHDIELKTIGEIKIHIENTCPTEYVKDRGLQVFYQLGLQKTKGQTGVLIYLAVEDRKMCILGDEAINRKVNDEYWNHLLQAGIQYFKASQYYEGLRQILESVGKTLIQYFPENKTPINEIDNEISFQNN